MANPAENRIKLLWNKYLTYDTVKNNNTKVAQFVFARAFGARIEAQYIVLIPMEGSTMQALTTPWHCCEFVFCDCFEDGLFGVV